MNRDILIGIIITAAALTTVILITWMARASIEQNAAEGYRTARETLKDRTNGK